MELFLETGLGIGGLRHAPLNLIMNNKPPSQTPWPNPPGRSLGEDTLSLYFSSMDLEDRYDQTIAKIEYMLIALECVQI